MVSYGYEQALRKLAPCDSPCSWDADPQRPPHVGLPGEADETDDE